MQSRTEADAELLRRLAEAEFQGPLWDRMAAEMASYAFPVMRGWVASGQVFAKLAARGIRLPVRAYSLSADDAQVLAEEAVADALVIFSEKMREPSRRLDIGGSLSTVFVTYCLLAFPNVYRRWLRHEERRSELLGDEGMASAVAPISDTYDKLLDRMAMDEALRSLPKRQREVISLRYVYDLSEAEIAKELGISRGAVKSHTARALAALRGLLVGNF